MKRLYILTVSAILLTSLFGCSTYKNSATTPDDVYYSPSNVAITTVNTGNNSDYYTTANDNYVKMRVQNPDRWSYFDDYNTDYYASNYGYGSSVGLSIGFGMSYGMGYSPYYGGFGYYSPMSYYNSYYAWNNCYNPYYGGVVVVNGKNYTSPSYTRMSNFNPSAYQGNYYNTRPGTHFTNANANATRNAQNNYNTNPNSNFNRSTNSRPTYYNNSPSPMRSAPSNFGGGSSGGGGGGASRGGGFSRPGR